MIKYQRFHIFNIIFFKKQKGEWNNRIIPISRPATKEVGRSGEFYNRIIVARSGLENLQNKLNFNS